LQYKKSFWEQIEKNYTQDEIGTIKWLSYKINAHVEKELVFHFFNELETAKKKLQEFQKNNSKHLINRAKKVKQDKKLNKNWYLKNWAYIYPHQIGIKGKKSSATFQELANNLDYYKDLNIQVLYLLPFYESPRKDGGYDISNFFQVDPTMGGNEVFDYFMQQALKKDFYIIIDFIPAHVSQEHEWFQQALSGSPKYLDYFLHSYQPPFSTLKRNGLDTYRQYYKEDGSPWYQRLLLLPDSNDQHWIPNRLKTGKQIYFHSTFFDHQKDLNLQNSNVIKELLHVLGYWIAKGVMGIRADAIHRWIKLPGSNGEHQPETFALAEYFNRFLKMLEPLSLFMPELVDVPQNAVRYLGYETTINNVKTTSAANALINFNKTIEVVYASLTGNFSSLDNHYKETRHLNSPPGTTDVLYTGIHHDEFYTGLLGAYFPNHDHVDYMRYIFNEKIHYSGGVVYKGGNSSASTIANLFNQDERQIKSFHKYLFGHYGSIAVFQGTELGLTNNCPHLFKETIAHLNRLNDSGHLKKEDQHVFTEIEHFLKDKNNLNLPPSQIGNYPIFKKYFDGRLLHRNIITKQMIDRAKKGKYPIYNDLKIISKTRSSSSALVYGNREEDLHTCRDDIGSFIRRFWDNDGSLVEEVAIIKNGKNQQTSVNISTWNLTDKIFFDLYELEYKKLIPYEMSHDYSYITISLQPYETLWLRVDEIG